MSVFAIITRPDGIALAADGVSIGHQDLRVRGFGSKIIKLPERRSVLVFRGPRALGAEVARFLESVPLGGSIDDLLPLLPSAFAAALASTGAYLIRTDPSAPNGPNGIVAGYSAERDRFESWFIFDGAEHLEELGMPARFKGGGVLHRLPATFSATTLSSLNRRQVGVELPEDEPDLRACLAAASSLIQASRD